MAKLKVAKKQWYPILAPKIFRNSVLGETVVFEPEQMVGKGITYNLANLTKDIKRQNVNIDFEVNGVQDGKALTHVVGYKIIPSSLKRMARRNIEKIDMSFMCSTSDKKNMRIKPIIITRAATKGSIASKIRKNAQDFLLKYINEISYDNFLNDLIGHKIQSSLKDHLKKTYPLRICEIRSMEVVDLEKKKEAESQKPPKKVKKAKAKEVKEEKIEKKAESKEKKEEKASEVKEKEVKEKHEEVKEAKTEKADEVKAEEAKEPQKEASEQ
ncbi:hypothetical protein CL615_00325 [archaeon]|jgi:ribosomal protein S3AE|nr:hypothetical protein [archaeon]MDP6547431.1 hypothetical protein [Candidatus Woesearchaeota archaeon]|tara:strand:- start:25231 stop:26040 length:810 start_codon:yes stop_codon:yes gene_type:complete